MKRDDDEMQATKAKLKRTRTLVSQYACDLAAEEAPDEQSPEELEKLGQNVKRYLEGSGPIRLPEEKKRELRRTQRLDGPVAKVNGARP